MKRPSTTENLPTGYLIGYARVSTEEQLLDLQLNALRNARCSSIYQEKVSGASKRRPQLDLAIKELQPGDTLVVWRLDRLGRDTRAIFARLDEIAALGASFLSLMENFDCTTAMGRLIMTVHAAFAQFERDGVVERTTAGMAAARLRGSQIGAPVKFTDSKKDKARTWLRAKPPVAIAVIARRLGLSPGTVANWIKAGKP